MGEARSLAEILEEYLREKGGLPVYCEGVPRSLVEDLAGLTTVKWIGDGFELRSLLGAPVAEWRRDPRDVRLYIYDLYHTMPAEGDTLDVQKAARLALCIDRILAWYLGRIAPGEDPIKALEELGSRAQPKEREEIIYYIYKAITTKNHIIAMNGDILCYNGRIYEDCEERVRKEVEMLAESYNLAKKTSRYVQNEVLAKIKARHYVERDELQGSRFMLAFSNGIVDIREAARSGVIELRPFSPDYYIEHEIPHRIDPGVSKLVKQEYGLEPYEDREIDIVDLAEKATPYYYSVFSQWVDGREYIALLYEIIGYTLYKAYPVHRAFMLTGEGSNGKSTYLGLIRRILGPQNVESVSLQALSDPSNRFAVIRLYKKLANIFPDIPRKPLKDTGIFKALTGEDPITADRKFRDPIVFVNYAKLIFSANELPEVNDMTYAFWRRWTLLEFPNQFPPNERFKRELYTHEEIPRLIAVSIYALRNVLLRMAFSGEAIAKEKWLKRANSVYAFIRDLLDGKIDGVVAEKDPRARVEASKLYELYTRYCADEDLEAYPKNRFTQEMARFGFPKVKVRGQHYYKGLRVQVDNPEGGLGLGLLEA